MKKIEKDVENVSEEVVLDTADTTQNETVDEVVDSVDKDVDKTEETETETEVVVEEKEEDSELEDKIKIETTEVDKTAVPVQNVRVRMRVDHRCFVGPELYDLKAGQCYNIPESVKLRLNKAGVLSPL